MKKILIVDDEFLIRYSLSHMLQSTSVHVAAASSGNEALTELSAVEFDLCCLDIHLPDMSGVEIMKRIRGTSPQTKIIMMTGGVLTKKMLAEIKRDSVLLLAKPFDLFKVKTLVDDILAGRAPAEDTVRASDGSQADEYQFQRDKRRHERQPVAGRISYSVISSWPEQASAQVIDVSEDGMCLMTRFPLAPGCQLLIGTDKAEGCECTVRWSMCSGTSSVYRSGIQFVMAANRPYPLS